MYDNNKLFSVAAGKLEGDTIMTETIKTLLINRMERAEYNIRQWEKSLQHGEEQVAEAEKFISENKAELEELKQHYYRYVAGKE